MEESKFERINSIKKMAYINQNQSSNFDKQCRLGKIVEVNSILENKNSFMKGI
eukprot:GAHX01002758.1.p5 GENE.GAHX01002758.1~~GAHX01002758.1.p5  ORF type:complete len:53 (-),score=9.34 GAHX01002758.1:129-287(-)